MGVSDSLRELARFLDEHDVSDSITDVDYGSRKRSDGTPVLTATFERSRPMRKTAESATRLPCSELAVDEDGTLQCTFELESLVESYANDRIDVEPTGIAVDREGSVVVSLTASLPIGHPRETAPTVESDATPTAESDPAPTAESDARERGAGDGATTSTGGLTNGGRTTDSSSGDGNAGIDPVECQPDASDEHGSQVDETSEGPETRFQHYDPDLPAFRNPDLLAEVYEACDTFAEMTDALDMDVTAETVRRYMVDYDIHEPNSYNTSNDESADSTGTDATEPTETDAAEPAETDAMAVTDGDSTDATEAAVETEPETDLESPAVIADGIGLPDDVTVESLISTVKRSSTIYEVKQDVGIDREDVLEMLRELNLLDLVVGRLATESDRDIRREEIIGRLREAAAQ